MNVFDRIDATLKLSSEEQMLVESVRQLARGKTAPRAGHYDRSGEFPHENVKAINELGLNAMFIPAAYGGAQLSYAAYLACVREISGACASARGVWGAQLSCGQAADRFRHGRAEKTPAAGDARRRSCRVDDYRAHCRVGCNRHEDGVQAGRR